MKKLLLVITMLSFVIPATLGAYYQDDYTDGIFNWTDTNSAAWYENTSLNYMASVNPAVYGKAIKTFPEYNFSSNLQLNISVYAQPGDYSFFTALAITNEDDFPSTNWLAFVLNEDTNQDGYDDIRIYCGGECVCDDVSYYGDSRDDPYYSLIIEYDESIGQVSLTRNDSNAILSNLSGCDLSTYKNVTLYSMHEPQAHITAFSLYADDVMEDEVCTPNWTCSDYGLCEMDDFRYCNETTDENSCGDTYTGNYSEFSPIACDYCTPNWTCSGYAACLINNTQYCNAVTDENACGDTYSGDYSEFEPQACTYTPSGYVIQYEAEDIAPIVLDGLGKFGVVIVSLITLVALVFLYGWLKGKIF